MHLDARGLPLSTASAEAAAAFDHLVTGYLTFRADTPARLTAVLEADPDFALAHCMQGYFAMLVSPAADQDAKSAFGAKAIRDLNQDVRCLRGEHGFEEFSPAMAALQDALLPGDADRCKPVLRGQDFVGVV
jgi:hypothetical protein